MEKKKPELSSDQLAFLWESKARIDLVLKEFISRECERIEEKWPHVVPLLPPLRNFVERDGKRIRPTLAILSYGCFSGKNDQEEAVLPSISTELMHDSFIIHDDLYDDIPGVTGTRRGEKVLHLSYLDKFVELNAGDDSNWEPLQFAKHATVTSTHILLALGARTIYQSSFSPEIKTRALTAYWETIEETWIGQGMDILSKGKQINKVDEDEILATELSRAGIYTAEFPIHLGAILGGTSDKTLQLVTEYARRVGLAFEIYDDVLGIFGEKGQIGKMQADLAEGKRTLLLQKSLEKGTNKQREFLLSLLGQRSPTEDQINQARQIIKETGALDYVNKLSRKLILEAKESLEKLDISKDCKEKLSIIAEFVISRKK